MLINYRQKEPKINNFFTGSKNLFDEKPKLDTKKTNEINSIINSQIGAEAENFAVFIKDLKTQQEFDHSKDKLFASASIYKLGVMYRTFDALKNGEITKDTVLSAPQQEQLPAPTLLLQMQPQATH